MGILGVLKKHIKKKIEKNIDTEDREKIRDRTQPNHHAYHYRLRLNQDDELAGGGFTFFTLGDSGDGDTKKRPKFRVAEEMDKADKNAGAPEHASRFILHLGDVVYLSGSKEGYPDRFIKPYQPWLVNKENRKHDKMIFNKPFLPIYGNHDYFDADEALFFVSEILGEVTSQIGNGSHNGQVFEEAFVETEEGFVQDEDIPDGVGGLLRVKVLNYFHGGGNRTRIPNRYYWFTYGNCAFFALDSNTLDGLPEPDQTESNEMWLRRELAEKRADFLEEQLEVYEEALEEDKITDKAARHPVSGLLEELAETEKEIMMLKKAKEAEAEDHDQKQLNWLKLALKRKDVRDKWKIVYMHHPLYTSERSHTDDLDSVGMRENLRQIFVDNGVHLVLTGHAHCFEWVTRADAKDGASEIEGEQKICYIVSGGGGRLDLRKSILEEFIPVIDPSDADELKDSSIYKKQVQFFNVAESKAYASVYHYLQIEVSDDELKIFPVGVLENVPGTGNEGEGAISPLPVKVITRLSEPEEESGSRMRCAHIKEEQLLCIKVPRDPENRPVGPVAEFV